MIDPKEERWLKEALRECFEGREGKVSKDKKLLEGFCMLIRYMVRNMKDNLNQARALCDRDSASKELREKFDLFTNHLSYLEKYCREKIDRKLPKE